MHKLNELVAFVDEHALMLSFDAIDQYRAFDNLRLYSRCASSATFCGEE